ncbi:outer membrane protein, adhesin transport system [Novimethylophilus kurashikiensis]|uniref:Outer membrane protein, adhesin transport system n=1 Tax=Novimethylophilus kurashikiensis TaxID=1825523 RepID=A0A2R5F710_9PROT|nr:TolC family outer membrane protein [Novimethylophilus kurashikiensis]GBG12471.1 outer membrane protein, adhesin transport system [Novimethylophilus kurashikiensis]
MNKKVISAAVSFACAIGFTHAAFSATLTEAVDQTIKTNPDILIDANQRLSTDEAVKQAKGGYYPKVDLNLGYGREWSENISTQNRPGKDATLWRGESGLTLSQMIYDGSGTTSEVNRQKSRQNSAAHKVMGTSEQIALKAIETYLDVLRREELLKLAQENLAAHDRTFSQIKLRADSGIGRKADLEQAQARLSLSQANVASAEANLREANIAYNKVIGSMPSNLTKPTAIDGIPASVDDALKVGLDNHPILRSALADIEATRAQQGAAEALMKPRVDLELGTNFNHNLDGVQYKSNDWYAMLRLRYNLFHGGADKARISEASVQTQAAIETMHRTQRQVEESLRLSWNSMITAQDRIPKLQATVEAAERTRDAYTKQFSIGQRTLLDLLDSENELYTDRSNLVEAQYIDIFARYRLMADMGRLLETLGVAPREEAKIGEATMGGYAKDVAKASNEPAPTAEPAPAAEPAAAPAEEAAPAAQ